MRYKKKTRLHKRAARHRLNNSVVCMLVSKQVLLWFSDLAQEENLPRPENNVKFALWLSL